MNHEIVNKIRLVVLDWAGTTIDFGSRAPAAAFAGVFAAHGIDVTDQQARAPMGLDKRDHLRTMLSDRPVAQKWQATHGRDWTETDVDAMYDAFVPIQLQAIERCVDLVPGLLTAISTLRSRDIQIGGTTGYFRAAADLVAERAAPAGYRPDANFCADDVPVGRPAPWMIYRVMEQLQVYPPSTVIKIGDTIADIQAGIAAGCWSVGVCDSSSLVGLSHAQYNALPASQRDDLLDAAEQTFRDAGAHHVIRTIADLPSMVDAIEALTHSPTAAI